MSLRPEELEAMRTAQEDMTMGDQCRISLVTKGAYNPSTFNHDTTSVVKYEGGCDLWQERNHAPQFGEDEREAYGWRLGLPADADAVGVGQRVEMLAARNSNLVGKVLNITFALEGTFNTRRVFVVEEVA